MNAYQVPLSPAIPDSENSVDIPIPVLPAEWLKKMQPESRARVHAIVLTVGQLLEMIGLTSSQSAACGMDILQKLREAAIASERLSSDLADEAHIDRGQFTHFMNGRKRLSFESAERLANVLGMTIQLRPLPKHRKRS